MAEFRIPLPKQILMDTSSIFKSKTETYYRDGVPIEKGAVLTQKRIRKHLQLY
jgi:hypothetical protein